RHSHRESEPTMVFDFGGRPRPIRPIRSAPSGAGGGTSGRETAGAGDRPRWLGPGAVLGALAISLVLFLATAGFWANLWWFSSLGLSDVLITRYVAALLSFLIGLVIAAVFIGINLWVALRAEGGYGLTVGEVQFGRGLSIAALIGIT